MRRIGTSDSWGGRRDGAGRPKKAPKEQLVVRVPKGIKDVLKFRAEILGYRTLSDYVIALLNRDALESLK